MNSKERRASVVNWSVHWLRGHGYEARRGQQFKGTADGPDVVTNLPYHIEVKLQENLNLHKAMEQTQPRSAWQ